MAKGRGRKPQRKQHDAMLMADADDFNDFMVSVADPWSKPARRKACWHHGTAVFKLDGRTIGAASNRGARIPANTALLVDCAADEFYCSDSRTGAEAELSKFVLVPDVIRLPWHDGEAPPVLHAFWLAVWDRMTKPGDHVVFTCIGGHGRTGTAIAAMLMVIGKMTAAQAVEAVRTKHCVEAIETRPQEEYLRALEGESK